MADLQTIDFEVGEVVEYDYTYGVVGALELLEARRKPVYVGQVVEVTGGHVDVIWENGRWASYGNVPWLGPLQRLRPV